jgi:hypothetical protein
LSENFPEMALSAQQITGKNGQRVLHIKEKNMYTRGELEFKGFLVISAVSDLMTSSFRWRL